MANLLRVTAGALGCLFIVAFQLQLLPFFARLFVDDRTIWPIIFYGCWTLAIFTTLLLLILQRQTLLRTLPVLIVCALSVALTLIHPIDLVARNFLVAVAFVACGCVLAVASAPLALLRLSAAATALSAVICLLDIFFTHGFTNTVGRAAGLSINANVAAAGLFLGAASSFWALPHRLRTSFLLITGAAILVTLSRSTLLAAVVICCVVVADLIWTRLRTSGPHGPLQWVSGSAVTLGLSAWIVVALFTNDRFSVAAKNSFFQIGSSLSAFEEAHDSVEQAIRSKKEEASRKQPGTSTPKPGATPGASGPRQGAASSGSPPARTGSVGADAAPNSISEEMIKEIARRAENEGDINSISARGLLMERAYLSYKTGPVLGQGLMAAHALQPHNMFLLFAIAFGFIGWFVPLAFLGLTAYWVRGIQQLPLPLAAFTVMMTSHDVLFTPGLLAPVIFGIAGLIGRRYPADAPGTLPALPYAALAAPLLFATGSIVALAAGASVFPAAPLSLFVLVFCAIALWAALIWHWRRALVFPMQNGAATSNTARSTTWD
jgi:hypothetical protein